MHRSQLLIIYWGLLCPAAADERTPSAPNLELDPKEESPSALASSETLLCSTTDVQWVKYKCPGPFGTWNDCSRPHCCPGFNLIDGRCISKDSDPCQLDLCEQRCSFVLQHVVCTCWDGYRFNAALQKRGDSAPACEDIDECAEGLHDCEQICKNTPGSFVCACELGYSLRVDNRTCSRVYPSPDGGERCLPSCDTVSRLQEKVSRLVEKLTALETAVSLSLQRSMPSRPPGTSSAVKGDVDSASAGYFDDAGSKTYSILDTFVQTSAGYCKCQRGPIGPPGPTGTAGPKGAAGERGPRGPKGSANFDFILMMIADLRHDVVLLQERVFPGEKLPQFDLNSVLTHKDNPRIETKTVVEDISASKTAHISDYATVGPAESSGDEWDQYE